jgi:hypothetical protein
LNSPFYIGNRGFLHIWHKKARESGSWAGIIITGILLVMSSLHMRTIICVERGKPNATKVSAKLLQPHRFHVPTQRHSHGCHAHENRSSLLDGISTQAQHKFRVTCFNYKETCRIPHIMQELLGSGLGVPLSSNGLVNILLKSLSRDYIISPPLKGGPTDV